MKSRVSTSVDTARLAEAVSRPGIDPRTWTSLAVVVEVNVDPDHGYLADVMLLGGTAAGLHAPARVGAIYAGPSFGAFLPLEIDDEVLVGIPSGDPAVGLVVLARMHDAATPPPADAANHPADLLLLAKTDATVRIAVQGSGDVVIDARGSGKVLLGAETGLARCAREGDEVTIPVGALTALLDSHYLTTGAPAGLSAKGSITSGSDKVSVK